MIAALVTLAFLTAIWAAVFAGMLTLGRNTAKIVAALKGQSLLASEPRSAPVAVRVSQRSRSQRPLRARPEWRAAA